MEFINCKEEDGRLSNMNISVAITDKFMKALEDDITFDLCSPSDGHKVSEVNARELWDRLAYMNWKSADPGILFIDNINKYNPLKSKILVNCSNPCGVFRLTLIIAELSGKPEMVIRTEGSW
jgi:ribonucleoside-diphosphate reductase alpha chain